MKSQWRKICDNLQNRLNPGTFKVWVSPLVASMDGERLCLTAPNEFVANWVRERLLPEITAAAAESFEHPVQIVVCAAAPSSAAPHPVRESELLTLSGTPSASSRATSRKMPVPATAPVSAPVATPAPQSSGHSPSFFRSTEQLSLPINIPLRQSVPQSWRYAFDGFVVGPTNDMAYAAARNMTRSGAGADTLFLSSGPGLGKTHLTQAVGQALCNVSNRANPKVEYLTAEEFSTCFVQALRARDIDRFKGRFRDIDLLLLEDVHFLQGKEKMQEEVLSTIKTLQGRGSRVVLTSSFAPCELRDVDNSLVSRFCSGFLAGIEKPDAATRRRILQEKAKGHETQLSDSVVDLLSNRLSGDIRQLESCVHNLVLKARLLGCNISVEMAQEILSQYTQDNPFLDVDAIIRKVCEGFNLSAEQLTSRSRKQTYVLARNTIFYLARRHTELSLQDIGDKFSRRHSTVLKGIASVERELRRESPLGRQIAGTLALIERG
ncbi:MAG: DnaA/Hda family protein [Bilophila sp.]